MSYSSSSTVPIEMLPGIGRRTAKVLRAMQVRTVGQFKALPEALLVELFGPSIRSVCVAVRGQRSQSFSVSPSRVSWLGKLKVALTSLDQEFDQVGKSV